MLHCCTFRMIRDVLPELITSDIIFNYSISYYQCVKIIDLLLYTGVIEAPEFSQNAYALKRQKMTSKYSLVFTFSNYQQFALIQCL